MSLQSCSALALWLLLVLRLAIAIRIPPSVDRNSSTPLSQQRLLDNDKKESVKIPSSPGDHLVKSLPLLEDAAFTTQHWAGHLPASSAGDKYFFYWLFAPDYSGSDVSTTAPLIIWLNGGPACSSMDGLFLENGPFRFVKGDGDVLQLEADPNSWHKIPAYVLYIDQPVGTGLSFTTSNKYPTNDEEVNIDFYQFLQSFFQLHSGKFVQDTTVQNPLFFSGESHAGHYIPHMMNYIRKQNSKIGNGKEGQIKIPLAGGAICNGWTNPYYQYAAAKAAYGHSLVDHAQVLALDQKEIACQKLLEAGNYRNDECSDLLDDIVDQSFGSNSPYIVSMYDARKTESRTGSRSFPPGHKIVETYLGGHRLSPQEGQMSMDIYLAVLIALHAEATYEQARQRYQECTDPPYEALKHLDGKGVVEDLVQVLEHNSDSNNGEKIRMLFFNGVEDLICNHVGNEAVLENLPWKYQKNWTEAKRYAWKAKQEVVVSGYMKEFGNLLFLKLLRAGHMVPLDIPETAFEMIQIFVSNGDFSSHEQKLDRSAITETCQATCPASGTSSPAILTMVATVLVMLLLAAAIRYKWRSMKRKGHAVVSPDDIELSETRYTD